MPMPTTTKTDVMLSGLRSAGAKGMNREELYVLGIANPSYIVERLREQGHSLTEELEELQHGGVTSVTTRFTLMVDGDQQKTMFEGDAADELSTWRDDPVWWDEHKAREAARKQ